MITNPALEQHKRVAPAAEAGAEDDVPSVDAATTASGLAAAQVSTQLLSTALGVYLVPKKPLSSSGFELVLSFV